jgi:hypothetical protein
MVDGRDGYVADFNAGVVIERGGVSDVKPVSGLEEGAGEQRPCEALVVRRHCDREPGLIGGCGW